MLHFDITRDAGEDFARAARQQNGQSVTVGPLTVERHYIIHLPLWASIPRRSYSAHHRSR